MTAHFQYSHVVDKPIDKVFDFVARNHVKNHPRWDPDIELWLDSDLPLGLGTVIRRRNSRSGSPVDGTMEVVEFVPNHSMGTIIHDGQALIHGRITFEAVADNQTRITTFAEFADMDETADKSFMNSRLERSGKNMRQLMESEL